MLRGAGKIILVLFLIWHMFAVAVFSTPRDSKSDIATIAKSHLIPFVSPYMYSTSQWQLWDIFAPDPIRRVTTYRIEIQHGSTWNELETFTPKSFSFFRHAVQVKLLHNILSEFSDNRGPYAGRFMQVLCMKHGVQAGTPVRLVYQTYVLPFLKEPQTMSWWRTWKPTMTDRVGFTSTCP